LDSGDSHRLVERAPAEKITTSAKRVGTSKESR
jgi:hypothetical protein